MSFESKSLPAHLVAEDEDGYRTFVIRLEPPRIVFEVLNSPGSEVSGEYVSDEGKRFVPVAFLDGKPFFDWRLAECAREAAAVLTRRQDDEDAFMRIHSG